MSGEFDFRAQSKLELLLAGPREGDETEVIEKGGGGRQTEQMTTALFALGPRDGDGTESVPQGGAFGPREGDETETTERGAGGNSARRLVEAQGDPRDGDETAPLEESPFDPPVQV